MQCYQLNGVIETFEDFRVPLWLRFIGTNHASISLINF